VVSAGLRDGHVELGVELLEGLLWSVGLLAVLCTLVYLQSTPILGWML
jgi:hypothetical protein